MAYSNGLVFWVTLYLPRRTDENIVDNLFQTCIIRLNAFYFNLYYLLILGAVGICIARTKVRVGEQVFLRCGRHLPR